jgi:hypothetical protein
MTSTSRPSDICITLVALHDGQWFHADEIRGKLVRLGFEGLTAQKVAAWLRRMERMDAPPVESRDRWGYREYRASRFGETWIHNELGNVWFAQSASRSRLMRDRELEAPRAAS